MQRTYFPTAVGGFYNPDYSIEDLLGDLEKRNSLAGFLITSHIFFMIGVTAHSQDFLLSIFLPRRMWW